MQKLLTFFSKNISICAIFNDLSFNNMLTNDIVSFEQLGPDQYMYLDWIHFGQPRMQSFFMRTTKTDQNMQMRRLI